MLYFKPAPTEQPPSSKIALKFKQPKSVTILKSKEFTLNTDWLNDFHDDKIEPFQISHEYFSFSPEKIKLILEKAYRIDTIWGIKPDNSSISKNNIALGFWAGDVGLVIVAETMRILTHTGEVQINQIPKLNNDWFDYWKKYWNVINTKKALPYDPLCEITISTK